jgi:phenylpropionate dioxygenase-like ring-hydroxylating dioxygenase large terminal subunit
MTPEENELLTSTGPGTPMGELFRRYWIPALVAEELAEPDGPPVRVPLLSERLVAFLDTDGRLGLVNEACPHRGTSLWFGRNEDSGIRCVYHGWKFDVTGQCTEVPSEDLDSGFCQSIKLKTYPLVERGGVLWTYMGPPEHQPPLPEYEFATVPLDQTYMSRRTQECNWLQAMEGGIDTVHVAFLHSLDGDPLFKGAKGNKYTRRTEKVHMETQETDGGMLFVRRRDAEDGQYYWRVSHWLLPSFTAPAPRGDHPAYGHFWIPKDDHNCWIWSYNYHPTRKLSEEEYANMRAGKGIHAEVTPGTLRPVQNMDNDYLIDRQAQRDGRSYSGVPGFAIQDAAIQESQGAIQDRTAEHLSSSDKFIVVARRLLIDAATALRDKGTPPPGVDSETHRVRAASMVLPTDTPFMVACEDALKAREGVPLATV